MRAPFWLLRVALLAGAACALFVSSPAVAQDAGRSGTYQGQFDNGTVAGPTDLSVTCDGGTCSFDLPSSSWVTVWRRGSIGEATTVIEVPADGGSVSVPMGVDNCSGNPWPEAAVDVAFSGDTMTFDVTVPVSVFEGEACTASALPNGTQESFAGTLVGSGDEPPAGDTDEPAQEAPTTTGSDATDNEADAGGEGQSVDVIAGGVVAVAAVAGGGALLVRRQRHRRVNSTTPAAGAAQPQVRPRGDGGRQSIVPSGPSTALSIRAIPGPEARITITRAGQGFNDDRIEPT